MRTDENPTDTPATCCVRCGRTLRAASSVALKMGATCARRARAEVQYKAAQIEKARELVELGAIVRVGRTTGGRPMFRIVASDGQHTYLSSRIACTCPAGRHGHRCYHRLSAVYAA